MAQTVHVWIRAENAGNIEGDSTITSMDRENSIEAFSFASSVRTLRGSGDMASGERTHGPVTIVKRIDRSSPILHQVLCTNDPLEVTIKFYRPNPSGDGTTEQFYTIELRECHISSISTLSPDCLNERTSNQPATEEVSFVFGRITWRYSSGDANSECEDHWSQRT